MLMPNLAENTSVDHTTAPQNDEEFSYKPLIKGFRELRSGIKQMRQGIRKMSEVLDAVDLSDNSAAKPQP
jgi:hypothetical protein